MLCFISVLRAFSSCASFVNWTSYILGLIIRLNNIWVACCMHFDFGDCYFIQTYDDHEEQDFYQFLDHLAALVTHGQHRGQDGQAGHAGVLVVQPKFVQRYKGSWS